jgi:hypothetical protein
MVVNHPKILLTIILLQATDFALVTLLRQAAVSM